MRVSKKHIEDNYQEQIKSFIIEDIKKANSYFEDEKERVDITNKEIRESVKTEFVALKILQDCNYEFIKIENEINKNFEFIEVRQDVEGNFEGLIDDIATEINTTYQNIFLKRKDNDVIFDYKALEIITDFIRWNIKFIKLLHKFKAKRKNGLRALKPYLNNLKLIIDNSYNEALKKEAQKEYDYYKTIEDEEKEYKTNGFIFEALTQHNKSYFINCKSKDVNLKNEKKPNDGKVPLNDEKKEGLKNEKNPPYENEKEGLENYYRKNPHFDYAPKTTLNFKNCNKLEKFIKSEIIKNIPKY